MERAHIDVLQQLLIAEMHEDCDAVCKECKDLEEIYEIVSKSLTDDIKRENKHHFKTVNEMIDVQKKLVDEYRLLLSGLR